MKRKDCRYTGRQIHTKLVPLFGCNNNPAKYQCGKQKYNKRCSQKSHFLRQGRKYKVSMLFRDEVELGLRTMTESSAKDLPRTDGNLCLRYVITRTLRVTCRINKRKYPFFL